ncbi:MAG: hypothetical protein ACP5QG_07910 [candidate division WOR-3 bacterium]
MVILILSALGTPFAGETFNLGLGARAWGMGGAYTALATDPSGIYWNSGGLSRIQGTGILAMHGAFWQGLSYEFASVTKEGLLGNLNGGLGIYYLGAGDIKRTQLPDSASPPGDDNEPVITGTTSYQAYEILIGLASPRGLGITIKALGQRADTTSCYGIGVDAGYLGGTGAFGYGIALKDAFTTPLFWSTGRHEMIAPSLTCGISFQPAPWIIVSGDGTLRVEGRNAAEVFYFGHLSLEPRLGSEVALGPARFRMGLNGKMPTLGAGFGAGRLVGDYALIYNGDLGVGHRFSLGASF